MVPLCQGLMCWPCGLYALVLGLALASPQLSICLNIFSRFPQMSWESLLECCQVKHLPWKRTETDNMSSPPKIVYRITIFFADRRAEVIQIGAQRDRARDCSVSTCGLWHHMSYFVLLCWSKKSRRQQKLPHVQFLPSGAQLLHGHLVEFCDAVINATYSHIVLMSTKLNLNSNKILGVFCFLTYILDVFLKYQFAECGK